MGSSAETGESVRTPPNGSIERRFPTRAGESSEKTARSYQRSQMLENCTQCSFSRFTRRFLGLSSDWSCACGNHSGTGKSPVQILHRTFFIRFYWANPIGQRFAFQTSQAKSLESSDRLNLRLQREFEPQNLATRQTHHRPERHPTRLLTWPT